MRGGEVKRVSHLLPSMCPDGFVCVFRFFSSKSSDTQGQSSSHRDTYNFVTFDKSGNYFLYLELFLFLFVLFSWLLLHKSHQAITLCLLEWEWYWCTFKPWVCSNCSRTTSECESFARKKEQKTHKAKWHNSICITSVTFKPRVQLHLEGEIGCKDTH